MTPFWKSVWNFAKSVRHWRKTGGRTATREQYDARQAICEACPLYDATARRCTVCGCWVAWKAALIENDCKSDCPEGKWPIV